MKPEEFNRLGSVVDAVGELMTGKHKLTTEGCQKVCQLLTLKFEDSEEDFEGEGEETEETEEPENVG